MKSLSISFSARSTIAACTLIAFAASISMGKDVAFRKKIDPGALQQELRDAGFAINFIDCSRDNCVIHMANSEKKDPMLIVRKYIYSDPQLTHKKKIDAMRTLYAKWQAGTITAAEKDELLKQLTAQFLGVND